MEKAVETYAAISFLVIGVSHLVRPKAWVAWFQALAARGTPGAFVDGFLTLSFGALIVGFHNVWHGPAVVLTVIGWAQVLKGASRFVAPEVGLRVMQRMTVEKAWYFQAAGVVALGLSAYLFWLL